MQHARLKEGIRKLAEQNERLNGQVAIYRKEKLLLGKRNAPVDAEEAEYLREVISNEIRKRRRQSGGQQAPVTLKERRSMDNSSISELLGQYKDLLVPWPDIMAAALFGK